MKTLTGKAKEHFEKWYYEKMIYSKWWSEDSFYALPLSMQFGVYQDWADSVGYCLAIMALEPDWYSADISLIQAKSNMLWEEDFKTRQEARNAALEKLNEIYNNKN